MTTKNANKKVTNIGEFFIEGNHRRGFKGKIQSEGEIDHRFAVEVSYEPQRDCILGKCDGICRCTRLEELEIDEDSNDLFHSVLNNTIRELRVKNLDTGRKIKGDRFLTKVQKYCIERLAVHYNVHDRYLYEINIVNGYYGEEIGSITFENQKELNNDIIHMLNTCNNDVDRVKFVLEKEYAYLLDELKNVTQCDIETFNVKDIAKNSVELSRIKNGEAGYIFELDYRNEPIGIIYNNVLIDGHNRTKSVLLNNSTKKDALYIVLY